MSVPPNPPSEDAVSRWNRRVLTVLGVGFLIVSTGVFLDSGVHGEVATLSTQGVLGKKAWQRYNCMVCHQFFGMGGYLGPDLTNVVDRLGEETVAWVLRNGRGSMPALDLSEEEIRSLVVFMGEMGESGVFPQRTWPPGWFPPANPLDSGS